MNIKEFFNEAYFCIHILVDSTKLRDSLEAELEIKLKQTDNKDERKSINDVYKRKLKSIYRIRNNAYAILLQKGFKCFKKTDGINTILYMNIENKLYDCQLGALKSILGDELDNIVENNLVSEDLIFDYELVGFTKTAPLNNEGKKPILKRPKLDLEPDSINIDTLKQSSKNKNDKIIKENEKPIINDNKENNIKKDNIQQNSNKRKKNKKHHKDIKNESSIISGDNLLDTFISDLEETTHVEIQQQKDNICPKCNNEFIPDKKFCSFCGYKIPDKKIEEIKANIKPREIAGTKVFAPAPVVPNIKKDEYNIITPLSKVFTREELDELDNDLQFDDTGLMDVLNDKKITSTPIEVKKEVNKNIKENIKENENDKKVVQTEPITKTKEPSTTLPQMTTISNDTPEICDIEQSLLSINRKDLIVDIYTLKVADTIINTDEEKQEDTSSRGHRRKKIQDAKDEVSVSSNVVVRDIKIYVFPLSIPENGKEISSDVLVYITQDDKSGSYCSSVSGIKSVNVATDIHNFLVRGSWDNGKFDTNLYAAGETLAQQCELSRTKEEIRPEGKVPHVGHPYILVKIEYTDGDEKLLVHACPVATQNEEDGLCKTVYLTENPKKQERELYTTKKSNIINFQFEEEILSMKSLWENDELKFSISEYK